jgi:Rps23 Pro-64 3,4-dihydroxylase Tpa1-like proline 4-hydroxylase
MSAEDVASWIERHAFKSNIERWRQLYAAGEPYPHLVIDDFFPNELAEEVVSSFPMPRDNAWQEYGAKYIVPGGIACKYELACKPVFPEPIRRAYERFLFSDEFVKFVTAVTGLHNLYFDYNFGDGARSGGLNAVEKGGSLVRHVDFNYSSELKKYRAVNVLVYLNKEWSLKDGGNLELWDSKFLSEPKTIISSFNRCLIFATNSNTYHGYEKVLSENFRKSLNLYFYTESCPPMVDPVPHKTDWKPVESRSD